MLKSIFSGALPKLAAATFLGAVLSVSALHPVHAAPAQSDAAPSLFSISAPKAQGDGPIAKRDRQVTKFRQVDINQTLLTAAADTQALTGAAAQTLTLNLFDGVSYVAVADDIKRTAKGVTWTGHLRDVDMGQVVLVTHDGVVSGNISMPSGRYHIRFAGNGVYEVQKIDQSLFPKDEDSVPTPPDRLLKAGASKDVKPTAQADDGSTIDVMVVYSGTTRSAAGGTSAIQSQIALAIAETNQSYLNSGITQRVRLVHAAEVAYTETGDLLDGLNCITEPADGCLDGIHAMRNTYGADLVSLWLEDGGNACGIAWLMTNVSTSFADAGFSTVARDCATGYYSFGHELGHNMGATHDVYVSSGAVAYNFAHGYVNTTAASPWRTVMAYNNACADVGKNCTRIQYWSNPDKSFGGVPMGNSAADNRQTLNNTASVVANFRQSVSSGTSNSPYTGLWWNSNESGWGISVTQHTSMIFAAIYTYDVAGKPIWYVMSSCPVSGASCTGPIYKVTGCTPPTQGWNCPTLSKTVTKVGDGNLTFDDVNNGSFVFTIDGVFNAKTITRQSIASGSVTPVPDYSDLWWNASESGWGVALTQQYGTIFATWYTYDGAGQPLWVVASNCPVVANSCSGKLYRVNGGTPITSAWNGTKKVVTEVGTVQFTFSDANNGVMSYVIEGVSSSRAITRQSF